MKGSASLHQRKRHIRTLSFWSLASMLLFAVDINENGILTTDCLHYRNLKSLASERSCRVYNRSSSIQQLLEMERMSQTALLVTSSFDKSLLYPSINFIIYSQSFMFCSLHISQIRRWMSAAATFCIFKIVWITLFEWSGRLDFHESPQLTTYKCTMYSLYM